MFDVKRRSYDLFWDQGSTVDQVIVWKDATGTPINLSGYSARMQLRPSIESTTVTLELTTANSRIVLGGAAGTIQLLVSASTMVSIRPGTYVYDLEMVSGSSVTKILSGCVKVAAEVTR